MVYLQNRILYVHAKLLQLCPTPCNPMDDSPPGSSVHGILQARILEWVAMPSCHSLRRPGPGTGVDKKRDTGDPSPSETRVLYLQKRMLIYLQ